MSCHEIAVFFRDDVEVEFATSWLPGAEIIFDEVLVVQHDDLAVLARGGLEFAVGRVIRLEVEGADQAEAIAGVVEGTCADFAVRVGAHDLGCGDPKVGLSR